MDHQGRPPAKIVPARLAVLGGGVAGCELAQVFASLGSRVSVVEMAGRLLPNYEPVSGELLAAAMRDQGIVVHTGVTATGITRAGDGPVTARLIIDEYRQVIADATFVGPAVGELLHAATIAVVGQVPLDRLWHAVPSYPTISGV